jgi:hypothetical protein
LALPAAVQDEDVEQVDRMLAEFRDLEGRFQIKSNVRWPNHIRKYAWQLAYAGERLGRTDLLEQAADAIGQAISTGSPPYYDHASDWRLLGQMLVELARLDEKFVPGLTEALAAFSNALTIEADKPNRAGGRGRTLLALAEAHLVLAATDGSAKHIEAASKTLQEARPLTRADERKRWEAVNAELLSLQPAEKLRARDRERVLRQLDAAIRWETENEGDPAANQLRLKRLGRLRAALADAA